MTHYSQALLQQQLLTTIAQPAMPPRLCYSVSRKRHINRWLSGVGGGINHGDLPPVSAHSDTSVCHKPGPMATWCVRLGAPPAVGWRCGVTPRSSDGGLWFLPWFHKCSWFIRGCTLEMLVSIFSDAFLKNMQPVFGNVELKLTFEGLHKLSSFAHDSENRPVV